MACLNCGANDAKATSYKHCCDEWCYNQAQAKQSAAAGGKSQAQLEHEANQRDKASRL